MDFGELLAGIPVGLLFLQKGKDAAAQIWKSYGMNLILRGIDAACPTKKYYLKE
jgi:hypothetical protein